MNDADRIRKMAYAAVLAALTGAGGLLAIPLGPVPLTLQTFFVMLAGFVLGAKWGFVAITLYLLLGVAGLPVFSGGAAGAGHLLGPTGGYLLSFPVAAAVAGALAEAGDGRRGVERMSLKVVGGIVASALVLVVGSVRLMQFFGMSPEAAFAAGAVPFVIPSVIEIALAVSLSESLARSGVASASTGPRVRGVEERALVGGALGVGLVMSALIPWAHLSDGAEHAGQEGEVTAGVAGYFAGGEVTLSEEIGGEVVTATASAPSVVVYGAAAAGLGLAALALAAAAVRDFDETYAAAGYGVVGVGAAGVTAAGYVYVSGWSLEVAHSVGYGVYMPALMGVGLVALAAHTLRLRTAEREETVSTA